MMAVKFNNRSGFSLIELLMFIVILSFFSIASIRLLASTSTYYNEPIIRAVVIKKAQLLIESINLYNYNEINLRKNEKTYDENQFEFIVNVDYTGNQFELPNNEVKSISVEAMYKNKSFVLSTYRFNY